MSIFCFMYTNLAFDDSMTKKVTENFYSIEKKIATTNFIGKKHTHHENKNALLRTLSHSAVSI